MEVLQVTENRENYRIAGKFGGAKVWRIYSFRAFGKKSLANE